MNVVEFSNRIESSSIIKAMTEYFKQTMALYNMVNTNDIEINTDIGTDGIITYKVICCDNNDAHDIYTKISNQTEIYSYKHKFNCRYVLNGNCIDISIFK